MAKEAPTIAITIDDSSDTARIISNDVISLDWQMPRAVQDVTGVNLTAIERLLLLSDFSCNLHGVFNDGAAPAAHVTFKDANTTTQVRDLSLAMSGQTLTVNVWVTDYSLSRSQAGELLWNAPLVLADGVAASWS